MKRSGRLCKLLSESRVRYINLTCWFFSCCRVAGLNEPVLGGLLVKGAIAPGTRLLVGPLPDGEFSPVKVVSLHRNKAPCCLVRASQSASLTLAPPTNRSPPLPHFRPGMVLVSQWDHPHATLFFQVRTPHA